MGRLGTLKLTVPARSSKLAKIAVKGSVDNLSFPFTLLESQISSQPLAKRLILNFFHHSFLSWDAYDRALGRDVINDCADVGVSLEKESETFLFLSF